MRGFLVGITLGGMTSESDYIEGLQNWVAKYFHLSWDPSQVSCEVSKKVYHLVVEPI